MLESLFHFFQEGGPTMLVTATAGAFGVAIAFERGIKLYRDYNHDASLFMSRIKEFLLQNKIEDAIQYCNMEKKGLVAPVIRAGLERIGCDESIVRQSMESSYLEQLPKATSRLPYLALIANAGMLFGLMGTVFGLIQQFAALGAADAGQKQEMMATGIAHAMNNTALGLLVALPMLVIHGIYVARATKITDDMERGASQLIDWIGLHNYGQLKNELRENVSYFPTRQEEKSLKKTQA